MKFVRYEADGAARVGVLTADGVVDLADLVADAPTDMIAVITAGTALADRAQAALLRGAKAQPLDGLRLLAPIEQPGKFICMGLNYAEHVKEGGRDLPEFPTLFLRVPTSLLPPDGTIVLPRVSARLDFEAELLVVIGRRVRDIPEDEALSAVYGYSVFNDGTLRDFQRHTTQWTAGKNFDATGPFGPAILTADELPPGGAGLTIRSRLNGHVMQDGNTSDMIFPVARIVSYASTVMTLEPGDVIATGTPSGVGYARNPPVFMKHGDVIDIEIEGFPVLSNRVAAQE